MSYFHWKETTITDFSEKNISEMYDRGFVFTRIGRGIMHQTRSVRVDLAKFEPSSENRRIMKKIIGLELAAADLPLKDYDFKLSKFAKDFYEIKFGAGVMSAQKVKEMLADRDKSNFNRLLTYSLGGQALGWAICYEDGGILHYSYPFYDLRSAPKDMGLGMMTLVIDHAKNQGLKYCYLGSLQRPTDAYKLQFAGLEWFDGERWSDDIEEAKNILKA